MRDLFSLKDAPKLGELLFTAKRLCMGTPR